MKKNRTLIEILLLVPFIFFISSSALAMGDFLHDGLIGGGGGNGIGIGNIPSSGGLITDHIDSQKNTESSLPSLTLEGFRKLAISGASVAIGQLAARVINPIVPDPAIGPVVGSHTYVLLDELGTYAGNQLGNGMYAVTEIFREFYPGLSLVNVQKGTPLSPANSGQVDIESGNLQIEICFVSINHCVSPR